MPYIRVKLNDLRCAIAHLLDFIVAKATEEVVQLVIVCARAHTEDSFDFGKTSLRVGCKDAVLCLVFQVTPIESCHVGDGLLANPSKEVELTITWSTQKWSTLSWLWYPVMQLDLLADEVTGLFGLHYLTFNLLETFKCRVINAEIHQRLRLNVRIETAGSLRSWVLMVIHFQVTSGNARISHILNNILISGHVAIVTLWRAQSAIYRELSWTDGLRSASSRRWCPKWIFNRLLLILHHQILTLIGNFGVHWLLWSCK